MNFQEVRNFNLKQIYHFQECTKEVYNNFKKDIIEEYTKLYPYFTDTTKLSVPGLNSLIIYEDKYRYIEKITVGFKPEIESDDNFVLMINFNKNL